MNSSSRLFPVSLMKAEFAGALHEDVYQLYPGISVDRSLRINITRVTDPSYQQYRHAVVLLHSEFSNRRQWLTPEGEGFAAVLARAGFDVWLPEARGHGLSPEHDQWAENTLSLTVTEDFPAIEAFVAEQSGSHPVWIGEGVGGMGLGYALANKPGVAHAGAVLVDVATPHWRHNLQKLSLKQRWTMKRRGYADGLALGWGPEREPWRLLSELNQWHRLARRGQHPVYDRLDLLQHPVLLVGIEDQSQDLHGLYKRLPKRMSACSAVECISGQGLAGSPRAQDDIQQWLMATGAREARLSAGANAQQAVAQADADS